QTCWMEYLARFTYSIEYIKGEDNKVADCLLRYYASDRLGETHPNHEYVNADWRLDKEGDDLLFDRLAEVCAMRTDTNK
ncbi:hypothetical protein K474DRAFT_1608020, partial [Panus rudis PR-1116 ss-1]